MESWKSIMIQLLFKEKQMNSTKNAVVEKSINAFFMERRFIPLRAGIEIHTPLKVQTTCPTRVNTDLFQNKVLFARNIE